MVKQSLIVIYLHCLAIALTACNLPSTRSDLNGAHGVSSASCFPSRFLIDNEQYSIGSMIGEGSYGKVYRLTDSEGKNSEDHVLKVIRTSGREEASFESASEVDFARLLNHGEKKLTTTTKPYGIYNVNYRNRPAYFAAIIKDFVDGETAFDIITRPSLLKNMSKSYTDAFESFVHFKNDLIDHLVWLSDHGNFIADLHRKNLMYDGDKWLVVDGFSLDKDGYILYLESSYPTRVTEGRYRFLLNLLKNSGRKYWREQVPQATKRSLFQAFFELDSKNLLRALECLATTDQLCRRMAAL